MSKNIDVHLSLSTEAAKALARFARARGMKRAEALRLAVNRLLEESERVTRDAEMRAYVAQMAPHSGEFVRETSVEVTRRLREATAW